MVGPVVRVPLSNHRSNHKCSEANRNNLMKSNELSYHNLRILSFKRVNAPRVYHWSPGRYGALLSRFTDRNGDAGSATNQKAEVSGGIDDEWPCQL